MVGTKHHRQVTAAEEASAAYEISRTEWNEAHDKGDIADIVNAFTLATLNALVSDATLDDSGDSRTPTAHDLAGALHNADTLADLNAKISDATLVDMPNTIANVLSDHTKTVHDALGLSHDSLADVSVDDHHAKIHNLDHVDHPDVNIGTPVDGQMLIYDAATSKWKNLDPNVTIVDVDVPVGGQTDPLKVEPSGDMARKAYYDRNPTVIVNNVDVTVGSHAWTRRFAYTVPTGKKFAHGSHHLHVEPAIATAGKQAWCLLCIPDNINTMEKWFGIIIHHSGSGFLTSETLNPSFVLTAGKFLTGWTYHDDTVNHAMNLVSIGVEFDE